MCIMMIEMIIDFIIIRMINPITIIIISSSCSSSSIIIIISSSSSSSLCKRCDARTSTRYREQHELCV